MSTPRRENKAGTENGLSPHGIARRDAMLGALLEAQSKRRRTRHARRLTLAASLAAALVIPMLWLSGVGKTPAIQPKSLANAGRSPSSDAAAPTRSDGPNEPRWPGVGIVTNMTARNSAEIVTTSRSPIPIASTRDYQAIIDAMALTDDDFLAELRLAGLQCGLLRIAGGPARLLCPSDAQKIGG